MKKLVVYVCFLSSYVFQLSCSQSNDITKNFYGFVKLTDNGNVVVSIPDEFLKYKISIYANTEGHVFFEKDGLIENRIAMGWYELSEKCNLKIPNTYILTPAFAQAAVYGLITQIRFSDFDS